jgi:hypothetical protein
MTVRPTEQNPIKKGRVGKEVTEAKREDSVGCVTQFNTPMVVLIHGSMYGNPVADQRTHRGRHGNAALIFSFIWIKNLSWKLNVILHVPCAGGTVDRYVRTCATVFHMSLFLGLLTVTFVLSDEDFCTLAVYTRN